MCSLTTLYSLEKIWKMLHVHSSTADRLENQKLSFFSVIIPFGALFVILLCLILFVEFNVIGCILLTFVGFVIMSLIWHHRTVLKEIMEDIPIVFIYRSNSFEIIYLDETERISHMSSNHDNQLYAAEEPPKRQNKQLYRKVLLSPSEDGKLFIVLLHALQTGNSISWEEIEAEIVSFVPEKESVSLLTIERNGRRERLRIRHHTYFAKHFMAYTDQQAVSA